MVKTRQEMLDAAYVREVVLEIRRHAKYQRGYNLQHAFEDILLGELPEKAKLDKAQEAMAKAKGKITDRYQSNIDSLQKVLNDARTTRRNKAYDIVRAASSFFTAWIIQEVAKTGKVDDVINTKRHLTSEYAKAWIKGWRPSVKSAQVQSYRDRL